MDFSWLGRQIWICWSQIQYLLKSMGVDKKNSQYQVWLPFASCDTSLSHRVDEAVDCGRWNVVPFLFNGCVKLLDIGGNWNTSIVVNINPEHPKHAQRVTCEVSMQAMEELGHFQLPGIVYRSLLMFQHDNALPHVARIYLYTIPGSWKCPSSSMDCILTRHVTH